MSAESTDTEQTAPTALPDADKPPRARVGGSPQGPVGVGSRAHLPPTRDDADALILAALVGGKTHAEAAEIADVSPATVARRKRDPAFSRKLNDLRRDLIERTTDGLAAGTTAATSALRAVMDDPMARPGERAAAAKTLLDSTLKFQDQSMLLRRLRVLEDAIAADAPRETDA